MFSIPKLLFHPEGIKTVIYNYLISLKISLDGLISILKGCVFNNLLNFMFFIPDIKTQCYIH